MVIPHIKIPIISGKGFGGLRRSEENDCIEENILKKLPRCPNKAATLTSGQNHLAVVETVGTRKMMILLMAHRRFAE